MKWRVIHSGISSAAENMAIDEAILLACSTGQVPPTLRFYGWKPAAMSLGYFQKAHKEVNVSECQQQGVDVVRRLTGGRAVLHDNELTYSVCIPEDHPLIPRSITASYCLISKGLIAGLTKLGIAAVMSASREESGQPKKEHSSSACFDAPAQYELTVGGRKLAGSAQVRKEGVLLQHGSLLLDFQPEQVAALLDVPQAGQRQRLAAMLNKSATSVREILGRSVGWQESCEAISAAFGPALGVSLQPEGLTVQERAAAECLVRDKYSQDSWNFLR